MILYSNSCNFGVCSTGKTYSDFIGEQHNAKVINAGLSGSCNNRIFRTSIRDLLELKEQDTVTAIISLGALYRSEIWNQDSPAVGNDGHFESFQISSLDKNQFNHNASKFTEEWFKLYNDEAEITNLCAQLIMFTAFLEKYNIKYLIWAGAMNYKLVDTETSFLTSLYSQVKSNPRILDIFDFSFSKYCSIIKGYKPYDAELYGIYGHHSEEAHRDFANYLISKYEI